MTTFDSPRLLTLATVTFTDYPVSKLRHLYVRDTYSVPKLQNIVGKHSIRYKKN